ncbi:MAG: hypothetical protein JXR37_20385 [Kiritimatiellae bacterium]|nr:hypothetical protein [Kiritimatiellia bacterium]
MSAAAIETPVTTVEQRQAEILDMLTAIPTDTKVPWRSAFQKYTASLVKNVGVEEAVEWFRNLLANTPQAANVREARGGDPKVLTPGAAFYQWGPLMLNRVYHLLKDNRRFIDSGAAETLRTHLVGDILPRMRENTGYYTLDPESDHNENKLITRYSDQLLLEELAGPARDEERVRRLRYLVHHWALDKATNGCTEYFSPHYNERDTVPLLNLYDFAEDPATREWARMALDQFFAEFACVHINGFRRVACRRANNITSARFPCPELSDGRHDCFHPAAYVFFGPLTDQLPIRYQNCDEKLGYVYYATTAYRVPAVIRAIADPATRGTMIFRSGRKFNKNFPTRPDTCFYACVTPHYVLSSLVIPENESWALSPDSWQAKHGERSAFRRAVPWRVGFRDPRATVAAKRQDDSERYTGEPIALYGLLEPDDARALFQHENVVLYKGYADTYMALKPDIPAPGEGIGHAETDGDYRFYREAGADGETVYVGAVERNGVGVLEVGLASEHDSWEAFKSAVKANPARLDSDSSIAYTACNGTHIAYGGRHNITVDGQPCTLADWPLYESTFLNAPWANQSDEAGVITIGAGRTGRLVLDYRDSRRPGRVETT